MIVEMGESKRKVKAKVNQNWSFTKQRFSYYKSSVDKVTEVTRQVLNEIFEDSY